jgi:hypothetical protein
VELREPINESDVLNHHYSGPYPAARFGAGLFIHEPSREPRLAGVGVFSVPMEPASSRTVALSTAARAALRKVAKAQRDPGDP